MPARRQPTAESTARSVPALDWTEQHLSRNVAFFVGLLMVAGLGVIDYVTGPEVAFSIFYLLPIAFVEWRSGRERATVLCVIASASWLIAEIGGGQEYAEQWIPVWNTTTRVLIFLLVVYLLDGLRERGERDSLTHVLNPRAFTSAAERVLADRGGASFPSLSLTSTLTTSRGSTIGWVIPVATRR